MGIVIGIDVGGSTTKIVGINGEQIQSPMFITATDPVTSLFRHSVIIFMTAWYTAGRCGAG